MAAGIQNQVVAGKTPWHGSGKSIAPGQSVVESVSSDPILASEIVKSPMMVGAPNGNFLDAAGMYANVRKADNRVVGYVGEQYAVTQHLDLAQFADDLAGRFGLTFEIAGLLRGGSQFVLQARVGDPAVVAELRDGRPDTVAFYQTLGTAHDGVKSTEVGFATFRAECQNMTAAAMREVRTGKRGVRYFAIRHNGDQKAKLEAAGRAMEAGFKAWDDFRQFATKAATVRMPIADFNDFAIALMPNPDGEAKSTKAEAKRDVLTGLFREGRGNQGLTAWDAYNAVTEWANYYSPTRGADNDSDRNLARVNSTLYGTSATLAVEAEQALRVYVSL